MTPATRCAASIASGCKTLARCPNSSCTTGTTSSSWCFQRSAELLSCFAARIHLTCFAVEVLENNSLIPAAFLLACLCGIFASCPAHYIFRDMDRSPWHNPDATGVGPFLNNSQHECFWMTDPADSRYCSPRFGGGHHQCSSSTYCGGSFDNHVRAAHARRAS